MTGVLLLDKPAGFTSFDAVAVLRGLAKTKKVGHTGTLDPMATGVLPLLLGRATRAESLLPDTDKEYRAGFVLGYATNTQDSTGTATAQSERNATRAQVLEALAPFRGDILQMPPMFSAVQINGRRLYDLARKGIEVERERRPVSVAMLELEAFDEGTQQGTILVRCSKGTYIRTLCNDLGEALGTFGVMTALRRTRAAGFSLCQCITLEEARALAAQGALESRVLPVETLFLSYEEATVSLPQARRFCNGGALALERTTLGNAAEGARVRIKSPDGLFLGLGAAEAGELRVVKNFAEENETAQFGKTT